MTAALSPPDALRDAVARIGSQSAAGRLLGVTQQAVSGWIKERKHLPAEHVLAVEAGSGVSRHALRPDLYPVGDSSDPPLPAGRTEGSRESSTFGGSSLAGGPPTPDWNRRPKSQVGEPVR